MSTTLQQLVAALSAEKRSALAGLLRPAGEPIAIVGMACRFPGGADSPSEYWTMLRNGVDAVGEVPPGRWDIAAHYHPDAAAPGKMYTRWGGFLRDIEMFDAPFFGIPAAEAMRLDPQQRLLLETAWEALEDAGESPERLAGSRTGVFMGIVPDEYLLRQFAAEGAGCFNDPYLTMGHASSMGAGRLSYLLDFRGPNLALDTACSSSLVAVHLACRSLANGECDLALAGGVNAILQPEVFVQMCKMGMLSRDGRTKSFAAGADGFAAGDGCGFVLLKRLSDAVPAGNSIAALIRGSAVNQDGRSSSITAPNGDAQVAVIRAALESARVRPDEVGYIEAHGSGTSIGDPIEVEALAAVFGGRKPEQPLPLGAVKTNIGHLAAAAGIAGLIKAALALRHREIPPNLHFNEPNPRTPWSALPFVVPTKPLAWPAEQGRRIAGVSSFGWAGTNAHVVLEEPPAREPAGEARPCELLVLSAKSPAALEAAVERLTHHFRRHSPNLADAAFTLAVGRSHFEHRSVLLGRADGIFRLAAESFQPNRPVAFLLPDLSDYDGLAGQEFYAHEPSFREAVDACGDSRLPGFVLQWALARMWLAWGVKPFAVLGCGTGEAVASALRGTCTLAGALAQAAHPSGASGENGFAGALAELLPGGNPAVLELGAARAEPQPGTIASLPTPGDRTPEREYAAAALARLWQMGVPVDWDGYYGGRKHRRISLPTYPFERQRYWSGPSPAAGPALASLPRQELQNWFYVPAWKETAPTTGAQMPEAGQWLLFPDELGVCEQLAAWLRERGQSVVAVRPGEAFRRVEDDYVLAPGCREGYDSLLHDLRERGFHPAHIVHAWTVREVPAGSADEVSRIEMERAFYSLMFLSQAFGDFAAGGASLTVLSTHLHRLWDTELSVAERATALGICQVLPFEYPSFSGKSVDVDFPLRVPIAHLAGEIVNAGDPVVALRGSRRWTRSFERLPLAAGEPGGPWRQGGVYLITGGLGGVGLAIAEHLARAARARLVLVARTLRPDRLERVRALEASGIEVLAIQADVSQPVAVRQAVRQAIERFGTIHGVFHAAGVPGAGIIALKTREAAEKVLAPKVQGTVALRAALRGMPIDFLVLFSSVASATGGGAGQVDYSAAAAFQDACAAMEPDGGPRTVSLAWGEWQWNAWQEAMGGMDAASRQFFEAQRQRFGIRFDEGMDALERALGCGLPHLYISSQDLPSVVEWSRSQGPAAFLPARESGIPAFPRPSVGTSYISPGNALEETIAAVWKEQLRLEQIGVDDNFFELGGNSLVGLNLIAKLRARLGMESLPAHLLYEAPTIAALAQALRGDGRRAAQLDERERHGARRRATQIMRRKGN
jgi:polyketide synthase 12